MKSSVVVGTIALLGGSMAQTVTPISVLGEGDLTHVKEEDRPPNLKGIDMDACHKIDTLPKEGPNYPCVSQAWIQHLCRANGTSQEHLRAHRDCMCEGSSFFLDAKGCSSCKTGYHMQGTGEDRHWQSFFGRLEESFCKATAPKDTALEGDFTEYYKRAGPDDNMPRRGSPENPLAGTNFGELGVVAVSEYYKDAPEKQGPGKFTPVPPNMKDGDSAAPVEGKVPIDGQLSAPGKIHVQKHNSTDPTPVCTSAMAKPSAVSNKNTTSTSIGVDLYLVFLACTCEYTFHSNSMESGKFSCTPPRVSEYIKVPEQKDMEKKLPDVGGCGCFSELPASVHEVDIIVPTVDGPGATSNGASTGSPGDKGSPAGTGSNADGVPTGTKSTPQSSDGDSGGRNPGIETSGGQGSPLDVSSPQGSGGHDGSSTGPDSESNRGSPSSSMDSPSTGPNGGFNPGSYSSSTASPSAPNGGLPGNGADASTPKGCTNGTIGCTQGIKSLTEGHVQVAGAVSMSLSFSAAAVAVVALAAAM
ncbi:Uncharacterized protein TPAR_09305 [Tolypocladium paradoxum]|uniref:Uncharacterized protein n=1 Tax=Tolypocladium paradoxum TaxID=94208 RepID=A0A2S4L8W8_9HYPO|nr:Uncharacterized protein TPAR_09305 [Tolypocladium paradoxum]